MARGAAARACQLAQAGTPRSPSGAQKAGLENSAQTRYPGCTGDRDVSQNHLAQNRLAQDHPEPNDAREPGRILSFQSRRRAGAQAPHGAATAAPETEPVDDLSAFEEEDRNIDYRHRMVMNAIAVAIVTLLVGAGVWIADTIADMQKAQDCALQGRQNCAPIEVPAAKR
jgi:hypothetical protein